MSAVHLDAKQFDLALVATKKTDKNPNPQPLVVDFYAEWCGPCQVAAPIIDKLADEMQGKAVVAKLNVDENNEVAGKYGVMSIPTVITFKNGEEVDRQIGFLGEDGYRQMMKNAIEN